MKKILQVIDRKHKFDEASAHCDVPCGIYDPITAQISALTVVRMVDLLNSHFEDNKETVDFANRASRLVSTKEEHAEKTKHEIRIIWGDFLKEEHFKKYPELNLIVHQIMKLGSECKQHVDRELAIELLKKVNEFAEIFWDIKGESVIIAKAPYAPNLELVYRKI